MIEGLLVFLFVAVVLTAAIVATWKELETGRPYPHNFDANVSIILIKETNKSFNEHEWKKETEGIKELKEIYLELLERTDVTHLMEDEVTRDMYEPFLEGAQQELTEISLLYKDLADSSTFSEKLVINRSLNVLNSLLLKLKRRENRAKEENRDAA